jgi:hypothetical protein
MEHTSDAMEMAHTEARLLRWMIGLSALSTLAILLSAHLKFGVGFALGSALGILNYVWLHQIVEALVNAGTTKPPKLVLAKVFVRYPLMLAGVYFFHKTGWLPFTAVMAGFFVPVAGVLLEAVLLLRQGLN